MEAPLTSNERLVMALTTSTLKNYAEQLADTAKCEGNNMRTLCIAEILRRFSDEHQPLTNGDIRTILLLAFDMTVSENTVAKAVADIAQSGCLNLEIHRSRNGYWCQRTDLTPAQVRLLINATQTSRILTLEQSTSLQTGICNLVSDAQANDLHHDVFVEDRERSLEQTTLDHIDIIGRAIRQGRKIEFVYNYTEFSGKLVPLPSDNGELLRVETPIALLFGNNCYYVETYAHEPWRHGEHIMRSRIDRISQVKVSSQEADDNAVVRKAIASAQRRIEEDFDMFSGQTAIVFLRVNATKTNEMFDHFGYNLKFIDFTGEVGDLNTYGLTCVRVSLSPTFYRWLSGCSNLITIEKPPAKAVLSKAPWKRIIRNVTPQKLAADYRAAIAGYKDFLFSAWEPYEGR